MESENSESPWGLELVGVRWKRLVRLFKSYLVVWIKHNELELNIVCNKRNPLTILLLEDVDEVMNVNLTLVVFWVGSGVSVSILEMPNVVHSDHTSLMEVPLNHFCTEDEVGGGLDCLSFLWVSVGKDGIVAAHLGRA
jgi:hypothetical protein